MRLPWKCDCRGNATAVVSALAGSALLILVVAVSRLTVRRGRHERFRGLLGGVRRHDQQVPAPPAGREQDDGVRGGCRGELCSCTTWLETSIRPGIEDQVVPLTVTLVMCPHARGSPASSRGVRQAGRTNGATTLRRWAGAYGHEVPGAGGGGDGREAGVAVRWS